MDFWLIISQVIKPEYQGFYQNWMQKATDKEIQGMKLIGQIYKYKGRKVFNGLPPSKKLESFKDSTEFDYDKASALFRKSQTQSNYDLTFNSAKQNSVQKNIFNHSSCSGLELSKCLTVLAVQFIDEWLKQNDDKEFQNLVLLTLRSLYSEVKAMQVQTTTKQSTFTQFNDWKLSKPVRIDLAGQEQKAYQVNYHAIFKQRLKDDEIKEQLDVLQIKEGKQQLDLIIKRSFKP